MGVFASISSISYAIDVNWEQESRRILKSQLALKGVTYKKLARLLGEVGVEESPQSIANKLWRGTFSFVFFLQCMTAIGSGSVMIRAQRRVPGPLTAEDGWPDDE